MFGDPIESEKDGGDASLEDSETKWEYKIGEDGELTGPLTTSAMTKVTDLKYFRGLIALEGQSFSQTLSF